MGETEGFLEYARRVAAKQGVDERIRHYSEFTRRLSEEELREQAARCMNCGVPFCHSMGCPLGNLIPDWNDLVTRGRWQEAARRLHLRNNFPEVTGRVCPALCEASCVLGLQDEPVSIREIELTVIEKAFQEGWIRPRPPERDTNRRVAVVGSGPAGLAAAQQLRRAGHAVKIFEKADRPGGILRYGIPDFKLEKWVVDRRVRQLSEEGVQIECGVEAGRDISADYLTRKFDALCLCGGALVPRRLEVPGADAGGVHLALDYLVQQNRRVAGETLPDAEAIDASGRRVVIIGGGDTGADCLGTALRQGAKDVQQLEILARPPEHRDESGPWPLWPNILRTSPAHEEGGERQWAVSTVRFTTHEGRVTGLDAVRVRWEADPEAGRPRFEPVEGSEFHIPCDLVLLAMGFVRPVHEGLLDDLGVAYDERGNVVTDEETLMTSVEGVFAAGDMMLGAALVVRAIAAGRRMACGVDEYLMGETSLPHTPIPRAGRYL